MRFPALLSAKFAKARIAALFRGSPPASFIDFIDAAQVLHPGSPHPVSHERIRAILDSPAPALWIGGGEPLEHPGISHLVRALAPTGRFVFLETRGALLRRRIHEFQPTPRFFLTIRFEGAPSAAEETRNPAAFESAFEAIRAARFSGFFTAIHASLREDADLSPLQDFASLLSGLDLDGWLLTSATPAQAALQNASEARKLIPNAQWRRLSAHLERGLLAASKLCDMPNASVPEKQSPQPCEEGVHIS
jgi:hypothetical protein